MNAVFNIAARLEDGKRAETRQKLAAVVDLLQRPDLSEHELERALSCVQRAQETIGTMIRARIEGDIHAIRVGTGT